MAESSGLKCSASSPDSAKWRAVCIRLTAPSRLRELDRLEAQLIAEGEIDLGRGRSLKRGTRLIRHWHGKANNVTVLNEGFEYEGQHYSSLSQIARQITGAAWSGPRFFGLKRRGQAIA